MYNRYVPQPDGSYRRDRRPDAGAQPPAPPPMPQAPAAPPPSPHPPAPGKPAGGFLEALLPPGFDLGDLIVLLLLLLMAGDSREARSNAILTMALYFIL